MQNIVCKPKTNLIEKGMGVFHGETRIIDWGLGSKQMKNRG